MLSKVLSAALAAGAILLAFDSPQERGRDVFARRCSGCHALALNKEGPLLRGVYGRRVAGVPGFGYSEALRKIDARWDDASLDRWLSNPAAMVPGNDMAMRLTDAAERNAVITYLKSLGPP